MGRTIVTTEELEITLTIWLSAAGNHSAASIPGLWTRTGEHRDIAKWGAASCALAAYLVEPMGLAKWVVTR